ncbi:MAG: helix-turn-helix domain-containing protein [Gammaproteobacteria bacterium]|nr:helix-turn-helix domain-containing protein [Gammaproteobacteria bacterium]
MTQRISLLAYDHCLASAVLGASDLFHAANMVAARIAPQAPPPFATQIVTGDGQPASAGNGYRIQPDYALAEAPPAQLIMLPGICIVEPKALLAALARLQPLTEWLRIQHTGGSWLGASCSANFLLADTGLLDGQPATTTTWYAELFEQRYPQVRLDRGAVLTHTDRIVCSAGPLSYIDLALYLIEQLATRELARACARFIVMDNRRGARSPELIQHHARTYDPLITKADRWMRANLKRDIRMQDIAAHVAVSLRTLMRRFKEATGASPQAYLQQLRLEAGKALLANTKLRLDQIVERVGYQDDSAFRRLFKRHTNLSPREYRQRFGRT